MKVATEQVRQAILNKAEERNDSWGREVKQRITPVPDLVSADAIHHKECFPQFFKTPSSAGLSRGRPKDQNIERAMQEIYDFLENCDDCQFTITELMEQITGYVTKYDFSSIIPISNTYYLNLRYHISCTYLPTALS